MKLSGH